jgi:response regulator RpfG family c-di-GMP phosphodiesterase
MSIPEEGLSGSGKPGTTKPLILVVDDEPLQRRAMVRVFGQAFEVLTAGSHSEAQRVLADYPDICVVITDCNMEEARSGIDLLYEVYRNLPEIGRILVSGTVDEYDAQELLARGVVNAVFRKPWDRVELLKAVTHYSSRPPPSLTKEKSPA